MRFFFATTAFFTAGFFAAAALRDGVAGTALAAGFAGMALAPAVAGMALAAGVAGTALTAFGGAVFALGAPTGVVAAQATMVNASSVAHAKATDHFLMLFLLVWVF
jgi:hypothetical protein